MNVVRLPREFELPKDFKPTAKGMESYIVNFSAADWARVVEVGPGKMRLEVWTRSYSDLALDVLQRMADGAKPINLLIEVCKPSLGKRMQLSVMSRLIDVTGWLRRKAKERTGGTWG